jgi:hypothetical protein
VGRPADGLASPVANKEHKRDQDPDARTRQEADARLTQDRSGNDACDDRARNDGAAALGRSFPLFVHARANGTAASASPAPPNLVNAAFTTAMRQFESKAGLNRSQPETCIRRVSVYDHVHVADRDALAEATDLMAHYGDLAQFEAAQRADRSRSLGNVVHFCRWRQIERTIAMLAAEEVTGTVH